MGPVNARCRSRSERRLLVSVVVPLAGVLLLAGLGYVRLQLHVAELGYRLSALREAVRKLETERRELQLEVAAAESPAQLQQLAQSLGMRPARWLQDGTGQ